MEYLKEIGLVELRRSNEKRERITPEVGYDAIRLLIVV